MKRGNKNNAVIRNVKRRSVKVEDRLSSLHDDIIIHILSFADAKLAVQTSTLSKRWCDVWKYVPIWNFDMDSFPDETSFRRFIRKFLRSYQRPTVASLILHDLPEIEESSAMFTTVNRVMRHVVSRKVQHVDLRNDEQAFPLKKNPYHLLFGNISITSLKLHNFFVTSDLNLPSLKSFTLINVIPDFKNFLVSILLKCPHLEYLNIIECVVNDVVVCPRTCGCSPKSSNFPSLKTLILRDLRITQCKDGNHAFDIFSSFVSLENLEISDCQVVDADKFIISCPRLVNLKILAVTFEAEEKTKIIVSTPSLASFKFETDIFSSSFEIVLGDITCLQFVDFHTMKNSCPDIPSKRWKKDNFSIMVNLFKGLRTAKSFCLTFDTIKVLSLFTGMLKKKVCPLKNLETLKVRRMGSKEVKNFQIPHEVTRYLCSGSPKLKKMDVQME